MHYVISFETAIFDLESEKLNTINAIKGYSVGTWFKPRLESQKIMLGKIDEESWGWYSIAEFNGASYMLGFIALPDRNNIEDPEIIVQVDRVRSFWEKLLGKNKIQRNDEVCQIIKRTVDNCKDFTKIRILNDA